MPGTGRELETNQRETRTDDRCSTTITTQKTHPRVPKWDHHLRKEVFMSENRDILCPMGLPAAHGTGFLRHDPLTCSRRGETQSYAFTFNAPQLIQNWLSHGRGLSGVGVSSPCAGAILRFYFSNQEPKMSYLCFLGQRRSKGWICGPFCGLRSSPQSEACLPRALLFQPFAISMASFGLRFCALL
jgi:hypothetical protein